MSEWAELLASISTLLLGVAAVLPSLKKLAAAHFGVRAGRRSSPFQKTSLA